MAYFPFFIDIENANGLIIGGGHQALKKIEKLLPYGVRLHVISPCVIDDIRAYEEKGVKISVRHFEPEDIHEGLKFVIIAIDENIDIQSSDSCDLKTDISSPYEENNMRKYIAKLCKEKRILVNSVDDIENCEFIFPALVKEGDISIGISTSGTNPKLAVRLKEKIRKYI